MLGTLGEACNLLPRLVSASYDMESKPSLMGFRRQSEATMQFHQGAHVLTTDGRDIGTVDRLVLDPRDQEITHMVVRKGLLLPEDKVIPIHLVASTTADQITLKAKSNQVEMLPSFEEIHYVFGDPEALRNYDVSGQVVPLYWYPPFTPQAPSLPVSPGIASRKTYPKARLPSKRGPAL